MAKKKSIQIRPRLNLEPRVAKALKAYAKKEHHAIGKEISDWLNANVD